MSEEKMYTQKEVDSIKTEERFIAYLVLSSADVRLQRQPDQYREARREVEEIVKRSSKYDDETKESFALFLVMVDNCVPHQDRPKKFYDVYNKVIADILAPPKE